MNNEERIAARAARKVAKKKVAIITPFPISGAGFGDDVKGSILRYMFPCGGQITKGFLKLGSKPKEDVTISFKLSNDEGGVTKEYKLKSRTLEISPKVDVSSGTCLDVSVESTTPVKEVWISFLWIPSIREVELKSYLEEAEVEE